MSSYDQSKRIDIDQQENQKKESNLYCQIDNKNKQILTPLTPINMVDSPNKEQEKSNGKNLSYNSNESGLESNNTPESNTAMYIFERDTDLSSFGFVNNKLNSKVLIREDILEKQSINNESEIFGDPQNTDIPKFDIFDNRKNKKDKCGTEKSTLNDISSYEVRLKVLSTSVHTEDNEKSGLSNTTDTHLIIHDTDGDSSKTQLSDNHISLKSGSTIFDSLGNFVNTHSSQNSIYVESSPAIFGIDGDYSDNQNLIDSVFYKSISDITNPDTNFRSDQKSPNSVTLSPKNKNTSITLSHCDINRADSSEILAEMSEKNTQLSNQCQPTDMTEMIRKEETKKIDENFAISHNLDTNQLKSINSNRHSFLDGVQMSVLSIESTPTQNGGDSTGSDCFSIQYLSKLIVRIRNELYLVDKNKSVCFCAIKPQIHNNYHLFEQYGIIVYCLMNHCAKFRFNPATFFDMAILELFILQTVQQKPLSVFDVIRDEISEKVGDSDSSGLDHSNHAVFPKINAYYKQFVRIPESLIKGIGTPTVEIETNMEEIDATPNSEKYKGKKLDLLNEKVNNSSMKIETPKVNSKNIKDSSILVSNKSIDGIFDSSLIKTQLHASESSIKNQDQFKNFRVDQELVNILNSGTKYLEAYKKVFRERKIKINCEEAIDSITYKYFKLFVKEDSAQFDAYLDILLFILIIRKEAERFDNVAKHAIKTAFYTRLTRLQILQKTKNLDSNLTSENSTSDSILNLKMFLTEPDIKSLTENFLHIYCNLCTDNSKNGFVNIQKNDENNGNRSIRDYRLGAEINFNKYQNLYADYFNKPSKCEKNPCILHETFTHQGEFVLTNKNSTDYLIGNSTFKSISSGETTSLADSKLGFPISVFDKFQTKISHSENQHSAFKNSLIKCKYVENLTIIENMIAVYDNRINNLLEWKDASQNITHKFIKTYSAAIDAIQSKYNNDRIAAITIFKLLLYVNSKVRVYQSTEEWENRELKKCVWQESIENWAVNRSGDKKIDRLFLAECTKFGKFNEGWMVQKVSGCIVKATIHCLHALKSTDDPKWVERIIQLFKMAARDKETCCYLTNNILSKLSEECIGNGTKKDILRQIISILDDLRLSRDRDIINVLLKGFFVLSAKCDDIQVCKMCHDNSIELYQRWRKEQNVFSLSGLRSLISNTFSSAKKYDPDADFDEIPFQEKMSRSRIVNYVLAMCEKTNDCDNFNKVCNDILNLNIKLSEDLKKTLLSYHRKCTCGHFNETNGSVDFYKRLLEHCACGFTSIAI